MLYFSFVHYKRKEFGTTDFALWAAAWGGFMIVTLFPAITNPLVRSLELFDPMQLIIITGMGFLAVIVFTLYHAVRKSQHKLEQLVTSLAIKEARRKR
jgi:hypothetical protein